MIIADVVYRFHNVYNESVHISEISEMKAWPYFETPSDRERYLPRKPEPEEPNYSTPSNEDYGGGRHECDCGGVHDGYGGGRHE